MFFTNLIPGFITVTLCHNVQDDYNEMTLMINALHTPLQSSKRYYDTICNTEHPCKVPLTFTTALPSCTDQYVVNIHTLYLHSS
jgi:hypothetical protein